MNSQPEKHIYKNMKNKRVALLTAEMFTELVTGKMIEVNGVQIILKDIELFAIARIILNRSINYRKI